MYLLGIYIGLSYLGFELNRLPKIAQTKKSFILKEDEDYINDNNNMTKTTNKNNFSIGATDRTP